MPPRLSITKLQRRTSIATDLLDLCQTITEDGHLDEGEIEALRLWLAENRGADLPAIAFLAETVERILADGRVTPDEHRELYRAIETVLPPDLRASVRGTRVAIEEVDKERSRRAKVEAAEARNRNRPVEHYDFMVAGVRYEGRAQVVETWAAPDVAIQFEREPKNRYSKNATLVKVQVADAVLGYVPETLAADLAPLLDSGHQYRARIKKVLAGGRSPVPVIVADIFRPDADLAEEGTEAFRSRLAEILAAAGVDLSEGGEDEPPPAPAPAQPERQRETPAPPPTPPVSTPGERLAVRLLLAAIVAVPLIGVGSSALVWLASRGRGTPAPAKGQRAVVVPTVAPSPEATPAPRSRPKPKPKPTPAAPTPDPDAVARARVRAVALAARSELVVELHSSASEYARAAAAERLGELADPEAIPALLDAVASDSSRQVRSAATRAITMMRGERARALLAAEDAKRRDPVVREAIAAGLAAVGQP